MLYILFLAFSCTTTIAEFHHIFNASAATFMKLQDRGHQLFSNWELLLGCQLIWKATSLIHTF